MKTLFNFDLTSYNSFKINISAAKFIEFDSKEDYRILTDKPTIFEKPVYILGGGFNTLFTQNFEGTILKISNKGLRVIEDNDSFRKIEVGAGETWNDLVNYTLDNELYGLENLIDIPGNVGSAPIQNIGAYGAEIADSIESVNFHYFETGKECSFNNHECKFGYRSSIFKTELKGKVVIKSVIFKLYKKGELKLGYGDIKLCLKNKKIANPSIKDIASIVSGIRASKLPDPKEIGNAGSFFKNPIIDSRLFDELKNKYEDIVFYPLSDGKLKIAAGWLIERAGWKGRYKGNAAVHYKQSLVLININNKATGKDILDLAIAVIDGVYQKFQIRLEPEVNIV